MNKQNLIQKIKSISDLTHEEQAELINLVNNTKKYGLVWEDKFEQIEEDLLTNLPVLTEVKERFIEARPLAKKAGEEDLFSTDQDASEQAEPQFPNHILIEGDNLHALTALSFTHKSAIDVIYIDPPYNTGNKDFKYNDRFIDKEDNYRHSKWLSFMSKRLLIAKELLTEKGLIFISIDDNENAQLKLLCDEIFGEENLISDVIWQSRKSVSNDTFVSLNHNYTLIYSKDLKHLNKSDFRLPAQSAKFENPDNDPRGPWVADPFDAPNLRPNLTYAIFNPNNGKEYWPPKGRCWRTTESEYFKFLEEKRIVFGKKGNTKPQLKRFLDFAEDKGATPISIWNDIETTTNGTQQLEDILGSKMFTNPKPIGLLDRILKLSTNLEREVTILDFFAGSGTTLHATMQLNAEDGGNRQCILVTNNENNICEEVTYERNKRVIQGYTNAKGVHVDGLTNNNLRYYKCDYVPSAKTEANRRRLTEASTDLLCIKENCYIDITKENKLNSKLCRLYTNGQGKYMALIYHSRNQQDVNEQMSDVIANLDNLTEKVKLYGFSPEIEVLLEDFYDVKDKVHAVPLPDAIYNAYRSTFKSINLGKRKKAEAEETASQLEETNLFNQETTEI